MRCKLSSLSRQIELFYALGESLPKNSDKTQIVLDRLEKLETFTAREKYADRNFQRLSSGSSRVVYQADLTGQRGVIKLAKNERGFAQNKTEANPKMKSKYINKVLNHAKDFLWIAVPFVEKITEKQFKELTDVDFKEFSEALSYGLKSVSGNKDRDKPQDFESIAKSDIYQELVKLGKEFHLLPGDMGRISSWGQIDNHPVLIDAGLTRDVYDDFYEDDSSTNNSS
jgi:hypothetical protein